MIDSLSHAISAATFQIMLNLFADAGLSQMTEERDYIALKPQEMVRLLEQPRTAGLRYYFTLTKNGKLGAVMCAIDSNGAENRKILLNAPNEKAAQDGIDEYKKSNLVQRTGTVYSTIGLQYVANGTIIFTQGKQELLRLAKTANKEVRAYFGMNNQKKTVLMFGKNPENSSLVRTLDDNGIIDRGADCPPYCR
jgi:hypothetical protein